MKIKGENILLNEELLRKIFDEQSIIMLDESVRILPRVRITSCTNAERRTCLLQMWFRCKAILDELR